MQKMDRYTAKPALLLLSIFLAIGPAFLFYLLVLQGPVISFVRLGMAASTIPFFAYLVYRLRSHIHLVDKKRMVFIGVGAIVLTLLGMQAIAFFPARTWLFYGRHTLILKPLSEDIELRGLQTSMGPISYETLDGLNGWDRNGNQLSPSTWPAVPLSWAGWTGESLRLDISGIAGSLVEVGINGNVKEHQISKGGALSIEHHFEMPLWGKSLIFLTLWLTISYSLVQFSLLQRSEWDPAFERPNPVVRTIFLSLAVAGIVVLLLKIYIPIHPQFAFPDRDSGLFLYAGRQILEGKIPYVDFWDHKGPLIYYLNAFGLILGNNSTAGVWALEIIWVVAGIICLYWLLRNITGELPAWLGIFIFLIGLSSSLGGGNFTEEYSLLFSILSLCFFHVFLGHREPRWLFLCGLMSGIAILLRPDQISAAVGIGIVLIAAFLFERSSRPSFGSVFLFGVGFILPVAVFTLYMLRQHAFADMFSAVIRFNVGYTGPLNWNLLEGFRRGLFSFPGLGFWIVAGLASLLSEFMAVGTGMGKYRFITAVMISAAAELFLSNLSKAGYKHYYITWLPYAAILTAFFGSSLMRMLSAAASKWKTRSMDLIYMAAAVVLLGQLPAAADLISSYYPLNWFRASPAWSTDQHPLNRLREVVSAESMLVMWGNEAGYNFMLDAESPSRFVYQYPLMDPEYVSEAMVIEFVKDLQENLPVIVDASAGNLDALPLEPVRRAEMLALPGNAEKYQYLQPLFQFIDSNYYPAGKISKTWIVLLPDQAQVSSRIAHRR